MPKKIASDWERLARIAGAILGIAGVVGMIWGWAWIWSGHIREDQARDRDLMLARERLRVLETIQYEQHPEYTAALVEATRGDR